MGEVLELRFQNIKATTVFPSKSHQGRPSFQYFNIPIVNEANYIYEATLSP